MEKGRESRPRFHLAVGTGNGSQTWYQTDYPRIRPARNPTGPTVGESNEADLAQWEAQTRMDAQRHADWLCEGT